MKNLVLLVAFFVAGTFTSAVFAQSSAQDYASRMNRGGFFRHDRSWGGAEVIYRSSGMATQADAMRWWMNSPPHRRLIQSGQITDIACVGNVCVGRSGGGSAVNYAPAMNNIVSAGEAPIVYTSNDGGYVASEGVTTGGVATVSDPPMGCDSCGSGTNSGGGSRRGILRRVFRR